MTKTTCPYCGVGCGIVATYNKDNKLLIKGDKEHPANFGRLCSKGSALSQTINHDGRLLYPEINNQRVDWENALNTVASRLNKTIEKYGPESVAFYVSGQLLTEDYYVANKLMKGFIGVANIDTNSRLCMSSAVAGYKRAFGSDTVPCDYQDIEQADLITLIGSNLAWCHPVLYQRIVKAKEQRPQLKIIVIDPVKTATCDIADIHLSIKPGTDVMLFNGLLNYLQREGGINWTFLEKHTEGFSSAIDMAGKTAQSIPGVASYCDIAEKDVAEFYRSFLKTEKAVSLFSQGINQSTSGTDKVNSIINCHLVTGKIGNTGMGPFSITGQPNAMGGREVGGLSNQLAAHMELENEIDRNNVKTFWNAPAIASKPGLKAVELFEAIENAKVKAIWIMATNPVVSLPDARNVAKALSKCDSVIVSDCIRNTDTNIFADILLPAQAWGEKNGTVTNSERRISRQRSFLEPPASVKPDWWIVSEVAKRMGFHDAFDYSSAADIFREHAMLSGYQNNGQRDFDISLLANKTDKEYEELQPVQWPVTSLSQPGKLFSDGRFYHSNHKAKLIAVEPKLPAGNPDTNYPLVLNTGRVRDHWHTLTRTGKSATLSLHTTEPYVLINPKDASEYNVKHLNLIKVSSKWGSVVARCQVTDSQRKGLIFIPIHWSKQFASHGNVGQVVNPYVDPISGQPQLKHTAVNIKPLNISWEGFLISKHFIEPNTEYWVRSSGKNYFRYQLAGSTPLFWKSWARFKLKKSDTKYEWMEYEDKGIGRYRAASIQDGKLESSLFVSNSFTELPDKSWLEKVMELQQVGKIERSCLLAGKPLNASLNQGQIVCSCFGVGKNTIRDAIHNQNLSSVQEIGECLQAGTNCGSCVPEIKALLMDTKKVINS